MINLMSRFSGRKKQILLIGIPVLILLGLATYLQFRGYDQDKASIAYQGGCNEKTVKELKKAYNKAEAGSATKANRAEQIGNCSALTNNGEAAKWYQQAQEDYKKSNDTSKESAMKSIVDNYEAKEKIQEPSQPDTITEEQKKQGIGSD